MKARKVKMLTTLLFLVASTGIDAAEPKAEPKDDWRCTQAADTGRWSCARDGVTADAMLDSAHASTAEPAQVPPPLPTIESEAIVPAAADSGRPLDSQAGLPIESVAADAVASADATLNEPAASAPPSIEAAIETEESAATVTPKPEVVSAPVENSTVQDTPVDPEATPDPEPVAEPSAIPTPAPAPLDANAPAFQRLAYVPDKPTSLLDLPGEFWVAQIMAVSSKEFLEAYAEEHNLRGLSAARIASGDRLFFVLILGLYETKDLAEQAITDMPPPYHKYKPLLRTLASLQQAMRKADAMAGTAEF